MATITHAGTWKDHGTCAQIGPFDALWYPEKGHQQPSVITRTCAGCAVQYECLTTALDTPSTHDFGWWAGNSEMDRRALRDQETPQPRILLVTDTATPEQAIAARRHAADGRSIAWISYATHLTGPAVRHTLRGPKTKRDAA